MKTLTKLAIAAVLALSAAAPAFAGDQDTLAQRDAYAAARQHQQSAERHMQRARHIVPGADAYATEPAPAAAPYDFSILSQH